MNEKIITKAGEIVDTLASKQGEGYCTIALIDESGYPTASTVSIIKADGIKQLSFGVSLDDNKARRVAKCNRASVCVNSLEYNITLVGTAEILTDSKTKGEVWEPWFCEIWSGADDPDYCVLRFSTERYSLYVNEEVAAGNL